MINFTETGLTSVYIISFNLILLGFVLEIFKRANISNKNRFITLVLSILWLLFLIINISNKNLFDENISSINFTFILFGFVGFICTLISVYSSIRNKLLDLSYELLLLPQGLRVFFGAGFLIEGVLGQMPKDFSILDGSFHIMSAFLALKAGLLYSKKKENLFDIWFANLFGITDIIIVALGIPFFLISKVGANHNMMYAAFFAAPVFVAFHFISIWKLLINKKEINIEDIKLNSNNFVLSNDISL